MRFHFDEWGVLRENTPEEIEAMENAGSTVIVLNHGFTSEGKPYWAYIAVRPSMYKEFMRKTERREYVHFADYGKLLRYGFDEEVPETVKQEMKKKYGCRDDYREKLAREVEEEKVIYLREKEQRDNVLIHGIISKMKH